MDDDTIYRQAAIDAFEKELTVGESKGNYVTICSAVGYEGAKQILESLPSAQPEIIKCKDCMHNGSYDTDCPIDWNGKEYCNFAERRC